MMIETGDKAACMIDKAKRTGKKEGQSYIIVMHSDRKQMDVNKIALRTSKCTYDR